MLKIEGNSPNERYRTIVTNSYYEQKERNFEWDDLDELIQNSVGSLVNQELSKTEARTHNLWLALAEGIQGRLNYFVDKIYQKLEEGMRIILAEYTPSNVTTIHPCSLLPGSGNYNYCLTAGVNLLERITIAVKEH